MLTLPFAAWAASQQPRGTDGHLSVTTCIWLERARVRLGDAPAGAGAGPGCGAAQFWAIERECCLLPSAGLMGLRILPLRGADLPPASRRGLSLTNRAQGWLWPCATCKSRAAHLPTPPASSGQGYKLWRCPKPPLPAWPYSVLMRLQCVGVVVGRLLACRAHRALLSCATWEVNTGLRGLCEELKETGSKLTGVGLCSQARWFRGLRVAWQWEATQATRPHALLMQDADCGLGNARLLALPGKFPGICQV